MRPMPTTPLKEEHLTKLKKHLVSGKLHRYNNACDGAVGDIAMFIGFGGSRCNITHIRWLLCKSPVVVKIRITHLDKPKAWERVG